MNYLGLYPQLSQVFQPLLGIIIEQLIFPIKLGILAVAKNRHHTYFFSLVELGILVVAKNHH